jgi:hypothetical protein
MLKARSVHPLRGQPPGDQLYAMSHMLAAECDRVHKQRGKIRRSATVDGVSEAQAAPASVRPRRDLGKYALSSKL